MNIFQKKSNKGLIISIFSVVIFALLMLYGLKHNPSFTPSQLIGKQSPDFEGQLSNGQKFHLLSADSSKSWKIINFWSSSCYVCREEASELQNFYETVSMKNSSFPQLVSVNIQDDSSAINEWQKNYKQTFPVIMDNTGVISINYGVTGTPETFLVDKNNVVRYRIAGTIQKNIILKFTQWLDQNPTATEDMSAQQFSQISSEG
jgi:cytochrome c biogenesis protein CcmG/thiol:disulfide interchange protein DsbE